MKKFIVALSFFVSCLAHAQWTPGKETVKAVIPFAPGGGVDMAFRHFQKYADARGINIVPIYKAGADGLIGATEVAESKPDGLTMGFGTVATASVHKIKHPNYNFDLVSVLRGSIMTMATHANSGVNNLDDLEKLVRDPAHKKTFGFGSPSQKAIWEQYFTLAKASHTPTLVPYKGGAPALQDAMGGHVDFIVVPLSISKTHIDAGKLKLLAVSVRNPWKEVSTWPNLNKKYPQWQNEDGFMIHLPQATNPEAVKFWRNFVSTYMNDPQVRQDFITEFTEVEPFGPEYAQQRIELAVKTYSREKK